MSSIDLLWFLSFASGMSLFLAGIIVGWSAIRRINSLRNWRHFLFGLGIIMTTSTYFYIDMTDIHSRPLWIYVTMAVGYILLTLAIARKKREYLLLLTVWLPVFLPMTSPLYALTALPLIVLAYLSYKNNCILVCSGIGCDDKEVTKERGRWATYFSLIAISTALYVLRTNFPAALVADYLQFGTSVLNIAAAVLLFRHVFLCEHFRKIEKYMLGTLTVVILLIASMSVFLNLWMNDYLLANLQNTVKEETSAAEYIAELEFDSTLPDLIEAKDATLNDFADRLFAKTGIRGSFFLGNERVAASLSASGKGRLLGEKITDTKITDSVLLNAEEYSGKINKGGKVSLATYVPIYKDDKVIGMYGTGKLLSGIDQIKNRFYILFIFISSATVSSILVLLFLANKKEVKAKTRS